ncbi:GNAT family N-acetyltransferase [Rhodoplanes sp. TEM]|uniref:GNAT family N-acetyltransferase n=1 Tax=Rhodoplanes tepidamans TaxID=200616 RepID=A0ABT5J6I9_RHOTP|nr:MULTISPECIES: GNAT family N-acetyltransferase [Rhodoplanes]MDC7785277.1 GNAT family N-acetyltransferase [Rhodoplanes tepidamans]MDC7984656.1 GNAT family N-acetyltransferase [Rhodoplanes sp. TEM]MDQ0353535.1 CelD/BcsL family acetyltransferase involved in cellulose biosynthesis [Rhodoplanes tepidamans]
MRQTARFAPLRFGPRGRVAQAGVGLSGGWALISAEEARDSWNAGLASLEEYSPFQSFEWGRYHAHLGWEPLHFVCRGRGGAPRAMCLALLRRFPGGVGFVWCVGGPSGDLAALDGLPRVIRASLGLRHLYVRFRCDRRHDEAEARLVADADWAPVGVKMGSSVSMELDLSGGADALLAGMNGKWRRNLRLARKEDVVVGRNAAVDLDELRALFAEMEQAKGLPELASRDKLAALFGAARPALDTVSCRTADGALIAFRCALRVGDRACDYLAAANPEGRRRRAAYLLLWEMLGHCRDTGIARYDLGGIDPAANPGVYEFKRTTGAARVDFLGEWDWATSSVLRWAGNWMIGRRQAVRQAWATGPARLGVPRAWVAAAQLATTPCIIL